MDRAPKTPVRGYFRRALNGADGTVKDSVRYADTSNRGFFIFNHSEPKAATAVLKTRGECAFCHEASARKDMLWTRFYRLLDMQPASPPGPLFPSCFGPGGDYRRKP